MYIVYGFDEAYYEGCPTWVVKAETPERAIELVQEYGLEEDETEMKLEAEEFLGPVMKVA